MVQQHCNALSAAGVQKLKLCDLQFAIFAAYAARLETAFLTDELASANALSHQSPPAPALPTPPENKDVTVPNIKASAAIQIHQVCDLHLAAVLYPTLPMMNVWQAHSCLGWCATAVATGGACTPCKP